MKTLLIILALMTVPAHALITCSDAFSGTGALSSGTWTQTTASGYATLDQSSGYAVTTASTQGQALCTGFGAYGNDQYAQAVFTGNNASLVVRGDTAGDGYRWTVNSGIFSCTAGSCTAIDLSGCPDGAAIGDTLKLSIVGNVLTCDDVTHPAPHTRVDSSWASGSPGVYLASGTTWQGTFLAGDIAPAAAPPTYSPAGPRIAPGTIVTIGCSVSGSTPYYTTDGTTPTTGSTAGTTVTVSTAETVKSICAGGGLVTSSVTSQSFTVNPYTWFIRTDGGTRYSTNVPTGQCNGLSDASYDSTGGSGVNQDCAYNDFRYMWDDDSGVPGAGTAWVIAGGDKVVVRGCSALTTQQNPSDPDCRIGWDIGSGGGSSNEWCYGAGASFCYNPPIPAGSSSEHTVIEGGCAYDGNCHPVTAYPYTSNNLTQIFGGFGTRVTINAAGASYVDFAGLEVTSHTDCLHANNIGGKHCSNSSPYDDFADSGFQTDATTNHVTFTDVYVHGLGSGFSGPIGAGIVQTRVSIDFNYFAGWNFQNGADDPNDPAATLDNTYVQMIGNGCWEEYPIVHTTFPARGCWDTLSNGFGDSWSGQSSPDDTHLNYMARFTCLHCTVMYNTKDGTIGPHVQIDDLDIENSFWYGNAGSAIKIAGGINSTHLWQNDLIVGNCTRMSELIPGAPQSYAGLYLSQIVLSSGAATFTTSTDTLLHVGDVVQIFGFNGSGYFMNGQSGTVTSVSSGSFTATGFTGTNGTYTDTGEAGADGAYLTNFCRAGGNTFDYLQRIGSVSHYNNNTIVSLVDTIMETGCGYYRGGNNFVPESNCGAITEDFKNTVFLGYTNPGGSGSPPNVWYPDPTYPVTPTASYTLLYGTRGGPTCGTSGVICADPLLTNEVAQTWPATQSALDVMVNGYVPATGLTPTSSSPLVHAGTTGGPSTDYYGNTQTSPATIGAVVEFTAVAPSVILYPGITIYPGVVFQ